MNISFTSGPWIKETDPDEIPSVWAGDMKICEIVAGSTCGEKPLEESKANARLIAASPDLLAALQEMCSMFYAHEQYDDDSASAVKLARAAINLATGQEP